MLRSTGNVKLPSIINIGMCFWMPSSTCFLFSPHPDYNILGFKLTVPGANLGVAGAALGNYLGRIGKCWLDVVVLACQVRKTLFDWTERLFLFLKSFA